MKTNKDLTFVISGKEVHVPKNTVVDYYWTKHPVVMIAKRFDTQYLDIDLKDIDFEE